MTKESRDRGSNAFFSPLADTGHDIDGESDVEDKYALDEMGRCEESSGAATESVIELCHGKSKFVSISEHLPSRRAVSAIGYLWSHPRRNSQYSSSYKARSSPN